MPYLPLTASNQPGLMLYYQDVGDGPPVVLIHGWPLSSRSWEAQVWPLAQAGYRVITYDRRGFGASGQPWMGYDYDTLAQDLHTLITALALQHATLLGFSMGGGEVARYISTYGTHQVSKAVFAAAVPPFLLRTPEHPEGALTEKAVATQEQAVLDDRLAFLEDFTHRFFTPQGGKLAVSEAQRQYARMVAAMASPKATHDCIGAFSRTDFRDDLAQIHIPTLVLHGDSDQIVPLEVSGARTHQAIAGSKLYVIPGGPHGCHLSHAKEFNRALLDFLKHK